VFGAWLIILPPSLLLAGLVLFAVGRRGRRIDDHPLCRRCGFDLVGTAAAASCPECGADLTRPRATRRGNRQRRVGMMRTGQVLVAFTVLMFAAGAYTHYRGRQPAALKPTWWLFIETKLGGGVGAEAADELSQRPLTPAQLAGLRATILAVQADKETPWFTAWGDAFERMRAAGNVPDEEWRRYAAQGIVLKIVVRPRVRREPRFPVRILVAGRGGAGSPLWLTIEPQTLWLNGTENQVTHNRHCQGFCDGVLNKAAICATIDEGPPTSRPPRADRVLDVAEWRRPPMSWVLVNAARALAPPVPLCGSAPLPRRAVTDPLIPSGGEHSVLGALS
jgi:hypothetical protein